MEEIIIYSTVIVIFSLFYLLWKYLLNRTALSSSENTFCSVLFSMISVGFVLFLFIFMINGGEMSLAAN